MRTRFKEMFVRLFNSSLALNSETKFVSMHLRSIIPSAVAFIASRMFMFLLLERIVFKELSHVMNLLCSFFIVF